MTEALGETSALLVRFADFILVRSAITSWDWSFCHLRRLERGGFGS